MTRKFKTADYDAALDLQVSVREVLAANHLARFVVDVIAQLDLSSLYARYGTRGGEPFAPEILLGLLFHGYATGVFSSRRIEKATHESIPFRFIAGNLHPDHDTIAHFRQSFLPELQELFVQVVLLIEDELALRPTRLENLAQAKKVLEARAQERYARERAEYEAKLAARAEKAPLRETKRKPRGRKPQPPKPEQRDTEQCNFTDPESRITPAPPQAT
jgi:transposase